MQILVNYNYEDCAFFIEAVGDENVKERISNIKKEWAETDDCLGEIEIVQDGNPEHYFYKDGPSYLIFEF